MNLKKIKEIINANLDDELTHHMVIEVIADDKNAIPDLMKLLDAERKKKRELIVDMNLELSRTHSFIEMGEIKKGTTLTKNFVLDKVAEFYITHKNEVTHCFNRFTDIK